MCIRDSYEAHGASRQLLQIYFFAPDQKMSREYGKKYIGGVDDRALYSGGMRHTDIEKYLSLIHIYSALFAFIFRFPLSALYFTFSPD